MPHKTKAIPSTTVRLFTGARPRQLKNRAHSVVEDHAKSVKIMEDRSQRQRQCNSTSEGATKINPNHPESVHLWHRGKRKLSRNKTKTVRKSEFSPAVG